MIWLIILIVIILIIMSKRSRNKNRAIRNNKGKEDILLFIKTVPSLCKGKTLLQIIQEYCSIFKKDNCLRSLSCSYTKEELDAIIIL